MYKKPYLRNQSIFQDVKTLYNKDKGKTWQAEKSGNIYKVYCKLCSQDSFFFIGAIYYIPKEANYMLLQRIETAFC